MIYYTKEGKPTLYPQTEEDRFAIWTKKINADIPYPTEDELERALTAPCRYRRVADAVSL